MSGGLGVRKQKAEQCVFGPITVVTVGFIRLGEKGAVTATWALQQGYFRVRVELVAALGGKANKGIVQSVQDQRWHGDAIDYASSGGAVVVVLRAGKSGVECGDAIVKLAQ